jgi:hypothetical protein
MPEQLNLAASMATLLILMAFYFKLTGVSEAAFFGVLAAAHAWIAAHWLDGRRRQDG